ncbi:MAG: sulfite exporter TauE/SafE family protein, partial [Traorella sp.]
FLGACAGLGGGVIIKPVLDFIGAHDLKTISTLSSCAVFTMAVYSTIRQMRNKVKLDYTLILLISIGAIIGGMLGNSIFSYLLLIIDSKLLNFIQALLLIILLSIVLMNVNTNHQNLKIQNKLAILLVGLLLGALSSFLSIGGGPINVAVFTFFFSIDIKMAAIYSIATILFSQASKLVMTLFNGGFMGFDFTLLIYAIPAALLGGYVGTKLNKIASEKLVRNIFNIAVLGIILLNIYNAIQLFL